MKGFIKPFLNKFFYKHIGLLFLLFGVSFSGLAQSSWVINIFVHLDHPDCGSEVVSSATASFAGVSVTVSDLHIVLSGTTAPVGTLTISATGYCSEVYDGHPDPGSLNESYSRNLNFIGAECFTDSYTQFLGNAWIVGSFSFYPKPDIIHGANLNISPSTPECGQTFTFTATCLPNYDWEVSNDPFSGYLAISGNMQTITVTATELNERTGRPYGYKWIRLSNSFYPSSKSNPYRIQIDAPAPIVSITNGIDPLCRGSSDGQIFLATQVFVPSYEAFLSKDRNIPEPISSISQVNGLGAGSYEVIIRNNTNKDEFGFCEAKSDAQILINPDPIEMTFTKSDYNGYGVSCNTGANSSNGVVTINPSGGAKSFVNFSWENDGIPFPSGTGQQTISGLPPGSYKVSFTDTNGCPANNNASPVIVSPPPPIHIDFSTSDRNGFAVSCNNGPKSSDGIITALPSGGIGGFNSFSWDGSIETSQTISGVPQGNYTIHLKDANGCDASGSKTILAPEPISLNITPLLQFRNYPVSCAKEDDGEITATASGGVGGFSYVWLLASTNIDSGPHVYSKSANVLYTVRATDGNSCEGTGNIKLTPPPSIDFTINLIQPVSCVGDKDAALEVTGIANAYGSVDFLWSTGKLSSSISGIGAGVGTVKITDQLHCSTTKTYQIFDPPEFTASIDPISNFNGSFIKCNGDTNGELAAKLYTDTGSETIGEHYAWLKDGISFNEGPSLNNISELKEGLYTVKVTYHGHCIAEQSINLQDPDPIDAGITVTSDYHGQPISCSGMTDASLSVTAAGGTGVLTYTWNTGATGNSLTDAGASDYSVIAKDVNQCEGSASITVVDPLPVKALISSVSDYHGFGVSCFGFSDGTIAAIGTGGTGTYNYLWNDGPSVPRRTSLPIGLYSLTVTDNNGCTNAIEQIITEPQALTLSVAERTDISCHEGVDGEVELLATGGVGQYEYSLNNGTSWQSQPVFSSLRATTFSFLVRDINLCTASMSTALTEPDALQLSFADILPAFCSNPVGEATAIVNGGVGNYSYDWRSTSNQYVGTQPKMIGVPAGIYTLKVTDAHACEIKGQVAITSTDGAKSTWTSIDTKCFDSKDGSAAISITAGDGPFRIVWPDGQNTLQVNNLTKGKYFVEITDVHDCAVVETVTVQGPDPITMNVTKMKTPTCYGSSDGEISLAASGGVGLYSFSWNNETTASQSQLAAGDYSVKITDVNQCVLNQMVQLTQPTDLSVQIIKSIPPICHDGCDGLLQVQASGGNGGYQYQWGSLSNTGEVKNICPGEHVVKITDGKGCVKEMTMTLANTPLPPLDLGGGVTLCVGQTYTLDAGDNWKAYSWKGNNGFSSNQQRVIVRDAGEYTLEAATKDGCVVKDVFLLETSLDLLKASFLMPHEAEVGDTVAFIDISWPLPETISWTFPGSMQKIYDVNEIVLGQFHKDGVYNIGLTANLGECRDYISKSITILKLGETEVPGGRLGYENFVKDFVMYPNPTDGDFEIGIELAEEASVTLSVWNSTTGVLMRKVNLNGSKIYKAKFDLRPLGFGTYVVRLDHPKGKEYFRFIVR